MIFSEANGLWSGNIKGRDYFTAELYIEQSLSRMTPLFSQLERREQKSRFTEMFKKEYKGYVDKVQGGHLLGWAWNPGNPAERLDVELFLNGEVIATARAEEFREDLKVAAVGDGMYGFRLPISTKAMANGTLENLLIRVSRNGTELSLSEECRLQLEKFSTSDSTFSLLPGHELSKGIGRIEQVDGNKITGWIVGGTPPSAPLLVVEGKPAGISNWPIPREDVSEALEVDHAYGFEAHVPFECRNAKISLFCVRESGKFLVDEREGYSTKETIFLQQLNTAREIASQKGAIAICCWDGAHNPIGRAKVLYDVAATERPVIIFSYLFDEFGGQLWKPLEDAPFAYLGIPWHRRHTFRSFLKKSGICFDTLWLCKPRYPTFELASYFAHPKTKLILDMDDNEEHFASSTAAIQKPYGMPGIGMARNLAQKITARTVASISLQQDFGGEIVRHTREPAPPELTLLKDKNNSKRIGFVGTVRAHKNLAQAARAIRLFGMKTMGKLEFHVYGDVAPEKHKTELEDLGVHVRGIIPLQELQTQLADLDLILTGYPTQSEDHEEINRYQISSKIGDALSMGKPVLVPDSQSVKDLAGIPGVYLFRESNFEEALYKALTEKKHIQLPYEFTHAGAYKALEKAEKVADSSPRAKECLSELSRIKEPASETLTKSLLLVWKQNDAGIYGRRIDQIARLYRRTHPDHRVIILELLHGNVEKGLKQNAYNYLTDAALQVEFSKLKAEGRHEDSDGVLYKQVRFESSEVLEDRIIQFLQVNEILPQNTTIVLFPYIRFLSKFLDFIRPYPTVVDMVDNQLMWSQDKQFQAEALNQFTELFYQADRILFNSDRNLDYFSRYFSNGHEAIMEEKSAVIPNWYLPPNGFQPETQDRSGNQKNIVYSGNMSDRIDWNLLKATALSSNNATLHLIGAASRSVEDLSELLELPNVVFHGALSEMETLHHLLQMDLAIIPHKTDKVSTYMNPLKVGMFQHLGLPIVAMEVPGISASEGLSLCNSRNEFIQKVIEILNSIGPTSPRKLRQPNDASGKQYMRLLSSL